MHEYEPLGDGYATDSTDDAGGIVVVVVRSGGIAGIRRRWRVQPTPAQAPQWVALVDQCPWDERMADGTGADRFVWSIHAALPDEQREQVVPDSQLQGAWRELVDAVREADTGRD